jgi:phosphatidylglycerophosphate synthase
MSAIVLCAVLLALAAATDALDGLLARHLRSVSTFGKWADPLTDALFFFFVYLAFNRAGLMPTPLLILFLVREAAQYGVLRPLAARRGLDPGAKPAGKVKTGVQIAGTAAVMGLAAGSAAGLLPPLRLATLSTAILAFLVAVSLGSLYWYVRPLTPFGHAARPDADRRD